MVPMHLDDSRRVLGLSSSHATDLTAIIKRIGDHTQQLMARPPGRKGLRPPDGHATLGFLLMWMGLKSWLCRRAGVVDQPTQPLLWSLLTACLGTGFQLPKMPSACCQTCICRRDARRLPIMPMCMGYRYGYFINYFFVHFSDEIFLELPHYNLY